MNPDQLMELFNRLREWMLDAPSGHTHEAGFTLRRSGLEIKLEARTADERRLANVKIVLWLELSLARMNIALHYAEMAILEMAEMMDTKVSGG